MMQAEFISYPLIFNQPAGTSRGVLTSRQTWFLFVCHTDNPSVTGIGECGIIPGLSMEQPAEVEKELEFLCRNINEYPEWIENKGNAFPSVRFCLETALSDLSSGGKRIFKKNAFSKGETGIQINGLIWMGNYNFMQQQIVQKLKNGFSCIKIKIGALDFDQEIDLIKAIRSKYGKNQVEIRVDANGAFPVKKAMSYLDILAEYDIHSIEQPIKQGNWKDMAQICESSPVPVALDEELIGVDSQELKLQLLENIKPAYIVLKPGLIGGFPEAEKWIKLAGKLNIGWWVTSALESNIGLNAIAQWTFEHDNGMIQGLGTGQIYRNNIPSPFSMSFGRLFHYPDQSWELKSLFDALS